MNHVEPIRRTEDIHNMYCYLSEYSTRDYIFFKFAIHTGIKLNRLLTLLVKDILDDSGEVIHWWMESSDDNIRVKLSEVLRQEIKDYIQNEHLGPHELLFQSSRTRKALSRQQAYRIINQAATRLNINHVGLTTLRKTFAYHSYQSGISISIIQKYLGHQSAQETLKFIGMTKQEVYTTITLNL
ncbi:tyrosine-type recombinase/integrase [Staphylococcus canis]|uniref:Tyrosine-type recombinase/integrase n=1 Tax=Staphylococcus canis TaxID=2724942 RepID=A0ABS0T993_9STAP|nr:tyrosine-type recombinase/integrase [Staphylococcus canis]